MFLHWFYVCNIKLAGVSEKGSEENIKRLPNAESLIRKTRILILKSK
jgi:hypothetical protein